ncbi:hypothetical protein B0H11DRAFT_2215194 [Mycena galericulata]|nr:hypothetical protein B0H11DRAFT_2215194 [Mycena galericulata]
MNKNNDSPAHFVPTIDSATLPKTPADEWAENTNSMLSGARGEESSNYSPQMQKQGREIPGSFPEEQQTNGNASANGGTLLDSAKTYLPAQDDMQRAMTGAGQAAKSYLPPSVAAYLPSSSSSPQSTSVPEETDPDLAPPRPPFAAASRDTSASTLTNASTEAQAGSPRPDSFSSSTTSFAPTATMASLDSHTTNMTNLSTTVHTGGPSSPHPVRPLAVPTANTGISSRPVSAAGSRFKENLVTPPVPFSDSDPDVPIVGAGAPDTMPLPTPHGALPTPPAAHSSVAAAPSAPAPGSGGAAGSGSAQAAGLPVSTDVHPNSRTPSPRPATEAAAVAGASAGVASGLEEGWTPAPQSANPFSATVASPPSGTLGVPPVEESASASDLSEGTTSGEGEGEVKGKDGKVRKEGGRRRRLVQRLKEKVQHIGGGDGHGGKRVSGQGEGHAHAEVSFS